MFLSSRSIVLAVILGSLGAAQEVRSRSQVDAAPAAPTCASSRPAAPDDCVAWRWQSWGFWFGEVRWNDNSDDEDGFLIEWKGQNESGFTWRPADSTVAYNLPSRPTFRYRVRAFNTAGVSPWSNWAKPLTGGGG